MKDEDEVLPPESAQSLVPLNRMPVGLNPISTAGDVGAMMKAVLDKGVSAENVAVVAALVKLFEVVDANDAKRAFAEAFMALKKEIKELRIEATKPIPDKQGRTKYFYAPYEEIWEKLEPCLDRNGFLVNYSQKFDANRICVILHLRHVRGHCVDYEFWARAGSGPPGANESQADGAASTYAKRYALCNCFNIIVDKDTDARIEGDGSVISPHKAAELERRVEASGSNKAQFLEFAGAKSFAEIPQIRLEMVEAALAKRERLKFKPAGK